MIEFKRIKIKNFMSFGNAWTEINLNAGKFLVIGKNGNGKSVIITESLVYALFGKPFRKINIPQLINSINQKDCNVELEFSIDSTSYLIKRGLRPNKFEIYVDGVLLKQEAATKDYQGYLETHILKITYKTFIQLLVLGSAVFTPFMQQPAHARREIVEDILGITIFSSMQKILKERIGLVREELKLLDVKIDSSKRESINQKRFIESLTTKKDDLLHDLIEKKTKLIDEQSRLSVTYTTQVNQSLTLQESVSNFDDNEFETLYQTIQSLKKDIKDIHDQQTNLVSLVECPICKQDISDDHKNSVCSHFESIIETERPRLDELSGKYTDLRSQKQLRDEAINKLSELRVCIKVTQTQLDAVTKQIVLADAEIEKSKTRQDSDIESEKTKLRELANTALKLIERKNELLTERSLQEVSIGLLKDTGVKASIVKEYLPVLNKLINKHLNKFEFFVNFELDENFNETIKSRARDTFQYASFSEGEKKRIDISILLAFRHIASMKNSSKINLLVADEIDSGMDLYSVEKYVDIISELDCNAWVVSHVIANTELVNKFDKIAYVEKVGDFSTITVK